MVGGAGRKKWWRSVQCQYKFELKFKAMGGSSVPHGLFYFCLFFSRLSSKKAMDSDHSLFCFRGE